MDLYLPTHTHTHKVSHFVNYYRAEAITYKHEITNHNKEKLAQITCHSTRLHRAK